MIGWLQGENTLKRVLSLTFFLKGKVIELDGWDLRRTKN